MKPNNNIVKEYLLEIQVQGLIERYGDNYAEKHKKQLEKLGDINTIANFLKDHEIPTGEADLIVSEINSALSEKFLCTEFDFPTSFAILKASFDKVIKSANELGMVSNSFPFIGTCLSRNFNAFADSVPGTDEKLIIFESEIFILANILSKIICSCLPDFDDTGESITWSFKKERIVNHISQNSSLREHFADFVNKAVRDGQPISTTPFKLPNKFTKLQYTFVNSIELFIVGHEYGHIYAGHLENAMYISAFSKSATREEIMENWKMEFQADELGMILMLNSIKNDDLIPFTFLGPELFFSFLDLDDRIGNYFMKSKDQRSIKWETHPPNDMRRQRIRNILPMVIPVEYHESYKVCGRFVEEVLELLWEDYKSKNPIS